MPYFSVSKFTLYLLVHYGQLTFIIILWFQKAEASAGPCCLGWVQWNLYWTLWDLPTEQTAVQLGSQVRSGQREMTWRWRTTQDVLAVAPPSTPPWSRLTRGERTPRHGWSTVHPSTPWRRALRPATWPGPRLPSKWPYRAKSTTSWRDRQAGNASSTISQCKSQFLYPSAWMRRIFSSTVFLFKFFSQNKCAILYMCKEKLHKSLFHIRQRKFQGWPRPRN